MSVAAVVNPSAGRHRVALIQPWLRLRLGSDADILELNEGTDIGAWAFQAAQQGCDRILVFGGDGTFRSVAAALVGRETPLGLVPTGTNNNIAASLGLPADPYEATEVALTGNPQWIAAGRVDGGYYFFEGVAVGLIADLWPIGEAIVRHQFRDVLNAPLTMARSHPVEFEVSMEPDQRRVRRRAFTLTISNSPVTGAHLEFAPAADLREADLHLTVYCDMGPLKFLAAVPELQRGHNGRGYTTESHRFRKAHITSEDALHAHADGVLVGKLPIDVESIPHAVRVAMNPSVRSHLASSASAEGLLHSVTHGRSA